MNKDIIQSCVIALLICFVLFKFLTNRTIEVEKFSNQPVVYTANGKDLVIE